MAIGLDVTQPPEPDNPEGYDYETCPFYGDLSVRGQVTVERARLVIVLVRVLRFWWFLYV